MDLKHLSPTAPAFGVMVLRGEDVRDASRLDAELHGRIAVGTQVLVVDVSQVNQLEPPAATVLASAAQRLHDERSGSLVLRDPSVPLLRQLRLMRLDHVFELDI